MCCRFGRILYPSSVLWINETDTDKAWLSKLLIPSGSPIQILSHITTNTKHTKLSICSTCRARAKLKSDINLFDNFGTIPDFFNALTSYIQYRKLAIANLWCNTFKKHGYTYLHSSGKISVGRQSEDTLRGMLGMLQEGDNPELAASHADTKTCMLWLKHNNPLYTDFYANLETMHGYLETESACGLFAGLPSRTDDIDTVDSSQADPEHFDKQSGLIFPAEISECSTAPRKPYDPNNVDIGKQVSRPTDSAHKKSGVSNTATLLGSVHNLSYGDKDLEAKIFPHLYPHGLGSWYRTAGALTIGAFHELRLLHVDRRWANDRNWQFFAFDRNMKTRISYANTVIATNKNRAEPLKAGDVVPEDSYYNYGHFLPATVAGSKSICKKQWLD